MKTEETGRDFKANNTDNDNRKFNIKAAVHAENGKVTRIDSGSVSSKDGGLILGSFSQRDSRYNAEGGFTITSVDAEMTAEVAHEVIAFVTELREDVAAEYEQTQTEEN